MERSGAVVFDVKTVYNGSEAESETVIDEKFIDDEDVLEDLLVACYQNIQTLK